MQNYWSKEDLANFNSSEVFKALEDRVIDTIKRVAILDNKIAEMNVEKQTADTKALTDATNEATKAVKSLSESANNLADDQEFSPDDEEEDDTLHVIAELKSLAQAAIEKKDMKLAYKIERTIDEILEQDVVCE